ncbi:MAG TPA: iron ABC transporter permease [Desulfotignum sp.]|nr:iron ABC transporter permease [Desulfotignum sp.]
MAPGGTHQHLSWILTLSGLAVLLLLVSAMALATGSADIPVTDIPGILLHGQGTFAHDILVKLRLPRLILGIAVGGSLGLAGAILQGLFRNPLVEPYTLGISGGASLGVCLSILFKWHLAIGIVAYPLAGFAGSLAVIVTVYLISIRTGMVKTDTMLLTGVMISFVCSSLVMLLMAVSSSDELQRIVFWIMGSLDETNPALIRICLAGSLTGLGVSLLFCLDLNALTLGEEEASGLGVPIERSKKILFITASILTGLSVAAAGIIMFAGLIVPHFMRMTAGSDHRILLLSSFLGGAVFLTLCDIVARTVIAPLELPVGVITGIIGGIVFIWVLTRRQKGAA